MALLKGEGTDQILYGGADILCGLRHKRGYLARPDHAGASLRGSDRPTNAAAY